MISMDSGWSDTEMVINDLNKVTKQEVRLRDALLDDNYEEIRTLAQENAVFNKSALMSLPRPKDPATPGRVSYLTPLCFALSWREYDMVITLLNCKRRLHPRPAIDWTTLGHHGTGHHQQDMIIQHQNLFSMRMFSSHWRRYVTQFPDVLADFRGHMIRAIITRTEPESVSDESADKDDVRLLLEHEDAPLVPMICSKITNKRIMMDHSDLSQRVSCITRIVHDFRQDLISLLRIHIIAQPVCELITQYLF